MPNFGSTTAQWSDFTATLLGREAPVVYGARARRLIRGRRVLVTGAAGSIGSELVRQVHALEPGAVYMLDHDESGMHSLQLDLHGHGLFDDDSVILCDIRDEHAIDDAIGYARPDIVLHAAAHKHLPLLERYPAEGVKTNVIGTHNVVSAARRHGVERFVNISTDKAAQPTSILGATKRIAELITSAYSGANMRTASVRFGNVLGSRGSFLHSLAAQVSQGVAVTVTDPEVTRYFMTIPEASGLVIEASALAAAGETYVLDMGTPVKIVDLVASFLTLTDQRASDIVFTGLRPGEKLHEELFDAAEIGRPTPHARIASVAQMPDSVAAALDTMLELRAAVSGRNTTGLRDLLNRLVPRADRGAAPAGATAHTGGAETSGLRRVVPAVHELEAAV